MSVRVRYAPSPTGYLHIGGARTAFFNWLFARKMGGTYILRFEDTDTARSTEESLRHILEGFEWLGLEPDEGGKKGGAHGPYRQTERFELYYQYRDQLVKQGVAYPCYCTEEELEAKRQAAHAKGEIPRYDGRCRKATHEDIQKWEAEGRKHAFRFKLPLLTVRVEDEVRGFVNFANVAMGDFVIIKSDGTPSYNFAVVVDDHHMEITHVIRGEDHLSNTPRQMFLYEALGWTPPKFAHLPMILGPDHSLLSKRHGAVSVLEYRDRGFLPDVVLNYTALLGWSHPEGKEIMTREEMIQAFSLERVTTNPAVFDVTKMTWMNSQYLHVMPTPQLVSLVKPFVPSAWPQDEAWRVRAVEVVKTTLNTLADFPLNLKGIVQLEAESDPEVSNILALPTARQVLAYIYEILEDVAPFEEAVVKQALAEASTSLGKKGKEFLLPIRCALTRQLHGPELAKVIPLLGREETLKRIGSAVQ